jgi:hypothetical protein
VIAEPTADRYVANIVDKLGDIVARPATVVARHRRRDASSAAPDRAG